VRLVVVLLGVSVCAGAQDALYLDLSTQQPNPLRHEWFQPAHDCERGLGSGSGGSIGHQNGLKLSLISASPASPRLGEAVDLELQLKNVGSKEVEIPWNLNPNNFDLPTTDRMKYYQANFSMTITWAKDKSWHSGGMIYLYGSDELPSTMHVLSPGKAVQFRVRFPLEGGRDESAESLLREGGTFPMTAHFFVSAITVTPQRCFLHRESNNINGASFKSELVMLPSERPN
jgi:hypothetical protein